MMYVFRVQVFVHMYIPWCSPSSNMHYLELQDAFFTGITMQFLQSSTILLLCDDLILKKNIAMQIFLMTVITFLPLYFKRNLVEAAENLFNSAA